MPPLLCQYVQESGRARRLGLPSEAIILNPVYRTKTEEIRRLTSSALDAPAKAFLTSTVCQRIAINSHIDRREDRRQYEEGKARCDLYSVRSRGTKQTIAPTVQYDRDAEAKERATRHKLETAVAREQRQIKIQGRRIAEQKAYKLKQLDRHLFR
jgi:superfamily II DNA helicase RecQ